MIASCKEFLDVQLRISEKKTLNNLNKNPSQITIRYKIKYILNNFKRFYLVKVTNNNKNFPLWFYLQISYGRKN